jgi:hypothetical protein
MSAADLLTAFVGSLAAYGALRWAAFACIAFILVRYTGWLGMFISHCVVAVLIAQHDIAWIETAMNVPGWDGAPDMDLIFWIGVAVRVIVVNCLLLPIALISYRYRVRDATDTATQTT